MPVIKEDPTLQLQEVRAKGDEWQKYHIDITFPEQDHRQQGYVYIGTIGLLGGVKYVTCQECGSDARVVRTERKYTGSFLWINNYQTTNYYDCEWCKGRQERERREQQEREEKESAWQNLIKILKEAQEKEEREKGKRSKGATRASNKRNDGESPAKGRRA